MWSYQAPHQQFDILLDSFEYMLEDFSLVHPQQEQQNYQYPMELSSIGWNQDKDLNNQFLKTKKGELASVNYRIEYEIPDVLELTRFESNVSHYRYRYEHEDTVLNFEVSFMTSLYPIYTVLDDMYADSQFKRQNSQMYQNYQTTLEKVEDSAYPLYIFRETYTFSSSESYINPFETEEVTMLFEIAKNCTLRITIDSDSVPAELVNHIRVTSAKEVGFYTNTEMRGDNLYSNLKRIVNQSEHLAEQWTIQLPNHWLEITNYLYSTDIFGSRSYYMDYRLPVG